MAFLLTKKVKKISVEYLNGFVIHNTYVWLGQHNKIWEKDYPF